MNWRVDGNERKNKEDRVKTRSKKRMILFKSADAIM